MSAEIRERSPLGRRFWRLVTSSAASNLSDGLFQVALPLMALVFTRSPLLIGGLQFVSMAPWLVLALPAGAIIDRSDRRRVMLISNLTRSLLIGGCAIAVAGDLGSVWLLYGAAFVVGVTEVFYDTAAQSMLPAVVDRSQIDRANSRLNAVGVGAQEFIGPPLAGLLVAAAAAAAFGVTAVLWLIGAAVLATLSGSFRPEQQTEKRSMRADIVEGLRFLWSKTTMRRMAFMVAMMNFASSAFFVMFVIYVVGDHSVVGLTEPQFGLLFATLAAGGVAGTFVAEPLQVRIGGARLMTLGIIGMTAYIATPAATANVVIIGTVAFVSGATNMMWNIVTVSYRQRATPDHLLGRLNSAYRLLGWGTRPLGAIAGGVMGQTLGPKTVFITMGALALAALIPNAGIHERDLAETT